MATKRPHESAAIHPSRQDQVPAEPSRKRQRKEAGRPAHITGPSFKKAHTVHDLKASIRSLRRLLSNPVDKLPSTVRVEKERALRTAESELAETEKAKSRSEVIGKWHKVRFFERQKAGKRVKRLRKEGKSGEDVGEKLREAEVDVAYAVYFPLEREYVPLFARKKKVEGEGEDESPEPVEYERQGDAVMWERVRKCMEDGTLEALRNGKLTGDGHAAPTKEDQAERDETSTVPARQPVKKRPKPAPKPIEGNRRERRKAAEVAKAESEEDSDGGFFE
ncbi:hypothetical protein LTR56_009673 [Elasticomyces elasticus]|nr:hypothetical protein LTR56_009673 [Elasticomyces elasticus]KAK3660173.1 hypothetical protein LTR22_008180 [Elasticomyces elasticus]KAK4923478.1 hypothetical protein LTR49_009352 [Elasticomyces elasticus]KAK5752437.1 hypothetical protein LTS12_017473 [Elasticomyces elasticus]